MAEFKKGDVVELKSGGPRMTVMEYDGESVTCTWFAHGEQKYGAFDPELLKKDGAEGTHQVFRGR